MRFSSLPTETLIMNDSQNFKGVIIEESLEDKEVLRSINIISTKIEEVTPEHKTPWLRKWTLHTVEIPKENIDSATSKLKDSLEKDHSWYIHFWNNHELIVIYKDKIFRFAHEDKTKRGEAVRHGVSFGIPQYQLDFPID